MLVCSVLGDTLHDEDIVHIQMLNKTLYVNLFHKVQHMYNVYIKSDKYKSSVLTYLNKTSHIIDQFKWNNKLLTNLMYQYLISCYENWSWLTMNDKYKQQLIFPKSKHFSYFLKDHGIAMHDVLPPIEFHYTHQHRPTKSYTYYKTIYTFKKINPIT